MLVHLIMEGDLLIFARKLQIDGGKEVDIDYCEHPLFGKAQTIQLEMEMFKGRVTVCPMHPSLAIDYTITNSGGGSSVYVKDSYVLSGCVNFVANVVTCAMMPSANEGKQWLDLMGVVGSDIPIYRTTDIRLQGGQMYQFIRRRVQLIIRPIPNQFFFGQGRWIEAPTNMMNFMSEREIRISEM